MRNDEGAIYCNVCGLLVTGGDYDSIAIHRTTNASAHAHKGACSWSRFDLGPEWNIIYPASDEQPALFGQE